MKTFSPAYLRMVILLFIAIIVSEAEIIRQHGYATILPLSNNYAGKPTKRALLIGVKGYSRPEETKSAWDELDTEKDVNGLAEIFSNSQGQFRFDVVKVLNTKEETTREKILAAIKTFLIDQTKENDIVYLHFSGHGSQVSDLEKTPSNLKFRDEFDDLDETLVASDYVSRSDGSKDIRDDEIENIIEEIKAKKPANITLSFDSCFSGTVTRNGNSNIRGGRRGAKNAKPFGKNESPSGLFTKKKARLNKDNVVVLSATRYDQTASESIGGGGVFSRALINALWHADSDTSYQDLYNNIVSNMAFQGFLYQTPQIEGDKNQKLFSNTVLKADGAIPITTNKKNEIILKAGSLTIVSLKSTFDIYEVGEGPLNGKPLFRGVKASEVFPFEAKLDLQPDPYQAEKLKTAKAYKTSYDFTDTDLKILTSGLAATSLRELEKFGIDTRFSLINPKAGTIRGTSAGAAVESDLKICAGKCSNEAGNIPQLPGTFFTIQRSGDGHVVSRLTEAEFERGDIIDILENEARWRFFSRLSSLDAKLNVKIRVVPATCIKAGPRFCEEARYHDPASVYSESGNLTLKEGIRFTFEVMNLTGADVYVSVLSTNEFGELTSLYPNYEFRAGISGENLFKPLKNANGEQAWQKIPLPFLLCTAEPFGREAYHIIATRKPVDLTSVFRERGEPTSPLAALFKSFAPSSGSRDKIEAKPINPEIDPNEWGVSSLPFVSIEDAAGKNIPCDN